MLNLLIHGGNLKLRKYCKTTLFLFFKMLFMSCWLVPVELQQDKNVFLCKNCLRCLVSRLSSLKPHWGRCENQVVLALFSFAACSITLKDVLKWSSATSVCYCSETGKTSSLSEGTWTCFYAWSKRPSKSSPVEEPLRV